MVAGADCPAFVMMVATNGLGLLGIHILRQAGPLLSYNLIASVRHSMSHLSSNGVERIHVRGSQQLGLKDQYASRFIDPLFCCDAGHT